MLRNALCFGMTIYFSHLRAFTKLSLVCIVLALPSIAAEKTFKVIILAGQSNMEGKAQNKLLEYQATDEKTKGHFAHLRKDNEWIIRDDVFINYLGRRGGLTIGYGSKNRTGMELEFGTVMGNHFDEPVLLIKAAWGGHSLFQKFRPPSAGLPDEAFFKAELEKKIAGVKRNNEKRKQNRPMPTMAQIKAEYGVSYRAMMKEVSETLANSDTLFPALKGMKPELAGFVWFQGWNDQYNGAENHYAENMKLFINDVRKDLKVPKLPFVIAVMGQNGSRPAVKAMKVIQDAQLSMQNLPEFKGNVKAIRTDVLIDKAAEELYPKWKENVEEWEKTGSDRGYHYLGSAIWFNRIGNKCAEAMLEISGKK